MFLLGISEKGNVKKKTFGMNKKRDKCDGEELVDQVIELLRPKVRKALEKDSRSLFDIEIDIDDIGQAIKKAGKGYSATRAHCACGLRAKYVGERSRHWCLRYGYRKTCTLLADLWRECLKNRRLNAIIFHCPNAPATMSGNSSRQNAPPCEPVRSFMTTSAPASVSAADHRVAFSRKNGSCAPATR